MIFIVQKCKSRSTKETSELTDGVVTDDASGYQNFEVVNIDLHFDPAIGLFFFFVDNIDQLFWFWDWCAATAVVNIDVFEVDFYLSDKQPTPIVAFF